MPAFLLYNYLKEMEVNFEIKRGDVIEEDDETLNRSIKKVRFRSFLVAIFIIMTAIVVVSGISYFYLSRFIDGFCGFTNC
jgi:hypothetical protein